MVGVSLGMAWAGSHVKVNGTELATRASISGARLARFRLVDFPRSRETFRSPAHERPR
jgi:hypothetical protein